MNLMYHNFIVNREAYVSFLVWIILFFIYTLDWVLSYNMDHWMFDSDYTEDPIDLFENN